MIFMGVYFRSVFDLWEEFSSVHVNRPRWRQGNPRKVQQGSDSFGDDIAAKKFRKSRLPLVPPRLQYT